MKWFPLTFFALCATAAFAHNGVTNPAVMARMNGMSAIGENVKVLGTMSKGQIAFDATSARDAAAAIARHSAESIDLFTAQENDPKSEARPIIWDNFDDFADKAQALNVLATGLADSIKTIDDVKAAMDPLGAACTACHKLYRE